VFIDHGMGVVIGETAEIGEGCTIYHGVTQSDDPLSQAMRGLIDNASGQEHQIALLWQAIEKLSNPVHSHNCVPKDAALEEHFEADKLNQLERNHPDRQ
jgi:serine O-acetyltransferase